MSSRAAVTVDEPPAVRLPVPRSPTYRPSPPASVLEPPTVAVPIELAELPRIRLPPVEKLEAPSTSSLAVAPALFPTSAWLATLTEELFTVNVCEERMSRPLS